MALTFVTFKWGDAYSDLYVERLYRGLERHHKRTFNFVCFSDSVERRTDQTRGGIHYQPIADPYLLGMRGCFARLRLFDPEWLAGYEISGHVVCLDLDVIITGSLDPVFDRTESFVILQGANSVNPCPYNGSMWMLKVGAHPEVWSDFSLDVVQKITQHEFPDDQGWLAHKIPNAAGWRAGKNGVYAFKKPGWTTGTYLPADARIVVFPGWRDPSKFMDLSWVQTHWR